MSERFEHFCRRIQVMANKHWKRCSVLLVIGDIHIKTTMRYHYITSHSLTQTNKQKAPDNTKHWQGWVQSDKISLKCYWECQVVSSLWRRVCQYLTEFNTYLFCDPVTLLLGLCPRHMRSHVHTELWVEMLVVASLINGPNLKHLKYPPTGKWIKTVWHIHRTEYISAMKRNKLPMQRMTGMHLKCILKICQIQKVAWCGSIHDILQRQGYKDRNQISGWRYKTKDDHKEAQGNFLCWVFWIRWWFHNCVCF